MRIFHSANSLILISVLVVTSQCKKEKPSHSSSSAPLENAGNFLIEDSATLLLSANLLYQNNDYNEASSEYGRLITMDSSNGNFLFRKGYCLIQMDSPFQALKYYLKASQLKYKEAECYYVLGSIHSLGGNDSLAINYLKKALKLEPDMEKAKAYLHSIGTRSQYITL